MALVIPPGVDAEGSVKVAWVPALTTPASPKLTELTATGALDISCYLVDDNFKPSAEQETSEDKRLCTKEVFETLGRVKWSIDNLIYVWDPQDPDSVSNKAKAAMQQGLTGFLVARWGKDVEAFPDFAVGDIVDVFTVGLGPQVPQPPEANSKLKVSQKPTVNGPVYQDRALVA